jgi:histidine ammonia-lyase
MTVMLSTRRDFTLGSLRRVAFEGEEVRFSKKAVTQMARAHESFQEYVEHNRDGLIYLVTSGGGPDAKKRYRPDEARDRWRGRLPWKGLSFGGGHLPEHTVRAAVFSILPMMIEGNTAVHPAQAEAVAGMLTRPMPKIPMRGLTAAGEIMPLFFIWNAIPEALASHGLTAGFSNGCPFASGMAGVCAIVSRRRLHIVEQVFALSIEAFRAPLQAYDPVLRELWGDSFEGEALDALGKLLRGGAKERRRYQAPVSYRILPRVLGQAHRSLARLERAAETSLRQVASNPTYVLPSEREPYGRAISTGGFHNGMTAPAIDRIAACWTDLASLAQRHIVKLHKGDLSELPDRLLPPGTDIMSAYSTTYVEYVPNDFVEEMRLLSQPSLLSPAEPAASEQDDVAVPTFFAYSKERRVAELFDATLAVLAVVASQALHVTGRPPPPPLRRVLAQVRELVPPVESRRPLGAECERLANAFSAATVSGRLGLGENQ